MGKIGLTDFHVNPGLKWNRDYICDNCGWRTFVKAGDKLTKPWVRCIITGRLECERCHQRCIERYNPEWIETMREQMQKEMQNNGKENHGNTSQGLRR